MKFAKYIIMSLIVFSLVLGACSEKEEKTDENVVNDFESCVAAGNPVMESYPMQCQHEGKTYTEEIEDIPPIGGETDEHGCLSSAGYSWSEEAEVCLRVWEITETSELAASKIAAEKLREEYNLKAVSITSVVKNECEGCYRVEATDKNQNKFVVELSDMQALTWNANVHVCDEDEKGEVACTREYRPVCGFTGEDSSTYSNGCTACSQGVDYWKDGECAKEAVACTADWNPVCGKVQVQCIRAPCDPIEQTFSNRCNAEAAGATDIREGECRDSTELKELCESTDNAKWVETAGECEYISQEDCESVGGTFYECGSACRNDPDAEFCTMQCVPYCKA